MATLRNSLHGLAKWAGQHLAKAYVAGEQLDDALNIYRRAAMPRGWGAALGFWNTGADPIEKITAQYRTALYAVTKEELNCIVALKAPAFRYNLSCLGELLLEARRSGTCLHFDAQHPESATPTFALLESAVALMAPPAVVPGPVSFPQLGCTLPSRWRRSLADAATASELGLAVRVVKGQWIDPVEPVADPRTSFLELVEFLAGRVPRVGVATHDYDLAREALIRLKRANTPCELEQLYGLPMIAHKITTELEVPVRLYIPYGQGFLPYALSQAVKKPQIMGWLVRDILLGRWKYL